MSFLSKIGKGVAAGITLLNNPNLGPLVASVNPHAGEVLTGVTGVVNNEVEQIGGIIVMVESIKNSVNLTAAQQLEAATPLVMQVIKQSSLMTGKKIADPAKFDAACKGITSNFADLLNSLHEDGAK